MQFILNVNWQEARAGYCVLLMTIYWLTSALPVAVTSLLPIVIFPLMDILSTSEVCSLYIKESNIVFFGGVVLALGVERSNLHRRIALRVILTFGTNPRWYAVHRLYTFEWFNLTLDCLWQAYVGFHDGQYAPVTVDFQFRSHSHVDPDCRRCSRWIVSSKNFNLLFFF